MKYLPLVCAALFQHKLRTIFTLLSVLAAFLLFGLLDSVHSAFVHAGEGIPGADRLVTYGKLSFGLPLPRSLQSDIQEVPGVVKASYGYSFSGTFRDPKNIVPIEAYEEHYLDLYPEWYIPGDQRQAFRTTRTGAMAGEILAKKYNWKVGDRIPLQTNLAQKDGSTSWTFDLVGIYRIDNPNLKMAEGILYINWDYLDEARQTGNGTVEWFTVKVVSLKQADAISQAIDALSANSDHETKTQSEMALYTEWLRRIADVGLIARSIMGAVFFTLILLTGNVMAQAVRERIPDLAILKTIGFPAPNILALVLVEAVLLLLLGAVLGLALATVVVAGVLMKLGPTVPMLPVAGSIWLRGLTLSSLIGLSVGVMPALRGMRLKVVDALSGR
ncbi:MAG: FtsX-like permease family protein [Terriglobia bacterium]